MAVEQVLAGSDNPRAIGATTPMEILVDYAARMPSKEGLPDSPSQDIEATNILTGSDIASNIDAELPKRDNSLVFRTIADTEARALGMINELVDQNLQLQQSIEGSNGTIAALKHRNHELVLANHKLKQEHCEKEAALKHRNAQHLKLIAENTAANMAASQSRESLQEQHHAGGEPGQSREKKVATTACGVSLVFGVGWDWGSRN